MALEVRPAPVMTTQIERLAISPLVIKAKSWRRLDSVCVVDGAMGLSFLADENCSLNTPTSPKEIIQDGRRRHRQILLRRTKLQLAVRFK